MGCVNQVGRNEEERESMDDRGQEEVNKQLSESTYLQQIMKHIEVVRNSVQLLIPLMFFQRLKEQLEQSEEYTVPEEGNASSTADCA